MRLRYVGPTPTTFTAYDVGHLQPGDEFFVPDDVADAFSARSDIEKVVDPPVARPPAPVVIDAGAVTGTPPLTLAVKRGMNAEDDGAVSDDH